MTQNPWHKPADHPTFDMEAFARLQQDFVAGVFKLTENTPLLSDRQREDVLSRMAVIRAVVVGMILMHKEIRPDHAFTCLQMEMATHPLKIYNKLIADARAKVQEQKEQPS